MIKWRTLRRVIFADSKKTVPIQSFVPFTRRVLSCQFATVASLLVASVLMASAATSFEPTNTAGAFVVKPGFKVELVVSEPTIAAPVAMAFDEHNRLFVLERPERTPSAGRIRLLEDPNGDGSYDVSTTYAENVPWPSAIACYEGGILVAAGTDILFLKDSAGRGNADVRRVVFTGFAGGNSNSLSAAALINNFNWGLDNCFHAAAAGLGGTISSPGQPSNPEIPLTQREDFRFNPRTLALEPEPGPSMSGLSFDNRGRRFAQTYTEPIQLTIFPLPYFLRDPYFLPPAETVNVSPLAPAVYPFNPAASTNQTAGSGRDTRSTSATNAPALLGSASGLVIYRGSIFPTNYLENAFIADPRHHLVTRAILRPNGIFVTAERAADERASEFLCARDDGFRPVQLINSPEGALYIADYRDGESAGRIYRIVPTNFRHPKLTKLATASTYELVAALGHTNGWSRDTASRLLFQRPDPAAITLLSNVIMQSRLPLARIHALHAIQGLGALREVHLSAALRDSNEAVREHAVMLVDSLNPPGVISDGFARQLGEVANDPSARVRYQLALSMGALTRLGKAQVFGKVLAKDPSNPWLRGAVLSSLSTPAAEPFIRLASTPAFRASPVGAQLLASMAEMFAVRGRMDDLTPALRFIHNAQLSVAQNYLYLSRIGSGLIRTRSSLALVDDFAKTDPGYFPALGVGVDANNAAELRAAAIELVGVGPFTFGDVGDWLYALLSPQEFPVVQAAAVKALRHFADESIAPRLLDAWAAVAPLARAQILDVLLARNERLSPLLTAIENRRIPVDALTSTQINFLRTHPDPNISARAVRLFGEVPLQRPAAIQAYTNAFRLKASAVRGRDIFTARCAVCHQPKVGAHSIGPLLADQKLNSPQVVASKILEPYRDIRLGYNASTIETKNAENYIGIVLRENALTVVLLQPDGSEIVLPKTNIAIVRPQRWSLMPAGVEAGLNPQAMADLLEYLVRPPAQ